MIESTPVLQWLRWTWVAVYATVVVVHLGHISKCTARGETIWHIGHVAMCFGMISMFLPKDLRPIPAVVWIAVFSGLLVAISVTAVRDLASGRSIDSVWLLSLVNMSAMLYMIVAPRSLFGLGGNMLAVYFAIEMIAWLTGVFADASRRWQMSLVNVGLKSSVGQGSVTLLSDVRTENVRVTPCLMTAGMSYMFIMMSYGF